MFLRESSHLDIFDWILPRYVLTSLCLLHDDYTELQFGYICIETQVISKPWDKDSISKNRYQELCCMIRKDVLGTYTPILLTLFGAHRLSSHRAPISEFNFSQGW